MKNVEKPSELNTILGKGSVFEGNIKVEQSLRIDGRVKGDVSAGDTMIVGVEGEVRGNVKVKNLILGGKVIGTVIAPGRVVLESKAELHGELKTSKLIIDEGAIFDGKCSMTDGKSRADKGHGEADNIVQ